MKSHIARWLPFLKRLPLRGRTIKTDQIAGISVALALLALNVSLPALSAPAVPRIEFILRYVGLLAERWFFFGEANRPQGLYYQGIS